MFIKYLIYIWGEFTFFIFLPGYDNEVIKESLKTSKDHLSIGKEACHINDSQKLKGNCILSNSDLVKNANNESFSAFFEDDADDCMVLCSQEIEEKFSDNNKLPNNNARHHTKTKLSSTHSVVRKHKFIYLRSELYMKYYYIWYSRKKYDSNKNIIWLKINSFYSDIACCFIWLHYVVKTCEILCKTGLLFLSYLMFSS